MLWPPWSSDSTRDNHDQMHSVKNSEHQTASDWSHYTDPRTIISTILFTTVTLVAFRVHHSYLRRIPEAADIGPGFFRKRSLFGTVTRVGDADNFHLFHTPGGRLAGWGWLPGREVPVKRSTLRKKTIHIRLAGIDAPEGAHFGKPAQPYSAEALAWLENYIYNRRVRAFVYKRDQYDRVVATVWVRRFLFRKDVGKEMLKAGLATVYDAKTGAEFGDFEKVYRKVEQMAQRKKVGMWASRVEAYESPRNYKVRMASRNGL